MVLKVLEVGVVLGTPQCRSSQGWTGFCGSNYASQPESGPLFFALLYGALPVTRDINPHPSAVSLQPPSRLSPGSFPIWFCLEYKSFARIFMNEDHSRDAIISSRVALRLMSD